MMCIILQAIDDRCAVGSRGFVDGKAQGNRPVGTAWRSGDMLKTIAQWGLMRFAP